MRRLLSCVALVSLALGASSARAGEEVDPNEEPVVVVNAAPRLGNVDQITRLRRVLDSRNLLTALVLLPLAPIGTRLGVWLNRAVDPFWFYRIVYALTFVIGAKLVWDGIAPVLA